MSAGILIVGNEVLGAQVSDANGPFLLTALRKQGVRVTEMRTVGDVIASIGRAIQDLVATCDVVLSAGGIGPTHDDVTLQGIALGLGLPIERHPEFAARIIGRASKLYDEQAVADLLRMADLPQGASVVFGSNHIPIPVCGPVIALPGVPSLLRAAFPAIADKILGAPLYTRVLLLRASEPEIAHTLAEVQERFSDVAIGSYPQEEPNSNCVKISLESRHQQALVAAEAQLTRELGRYLMGSEAQND